MDAGLKRDLEDRVRSGERLSRQDGIALYESDDLAWLGGLAHQVRTRGNGDVAHFTVNRHLDLANGRAAEGSSQRHPGEQDAEPMPVEEVVRLATELADDSLAELHLVNALHPTLPWRYYPGTLSALQEALPQSVAVKAFTATGIRHLEKVSGKDAGEVLDILVDSGLQSLTVGGDEFFDGDGRQHLAGHDTGWEDWSRIHRLAHHRGLQTPSTMLFGHLEEPRHRVDHVLRLRELQDETGGFDTFVPLRHQHDLAARAGGPAPNRLPAGSTTVSGAEVLKTFAVSRLLFDNVPHVTVCWPPHGVQTAQLALQHGADDLEGPVVEDEGTHGADTDDTSNELTRQDVLELIRDAGFQPVERNSRYEPVAEYEGLDPARRESPQPMRV